MSHVKDSHSESYAAAGVDVTAGYKTIDKIKPMVESTYIPGVIGSIGGFGGLFAPDVSGMKQPVLVSGADGVGTKLKIAFTLNKHDTVGIDAVAMCVNDIACSGAKPMFFLDYLAVGKLNPEVAANIVSGVAEGCRQAGCALIGGETAEMPGFYPEGEYDLAGFSVGIVDREEMLEASLLKEGDIIIGVASSGMHSNGFSLARHVLGDDAESLSKVHGDTTIGEMLLTPTRIYVKALEAVRECCKVKAVANITGGGWYENIPRALPENLVAKLNKNALPVPEIFDVIQAQGIIPERDMYNTFNMGVGLVIGVAEADAEAAIKALEASGERAAVLGKCVSGEKGIEIC